MNPYDELNVKHDATKEQIRKAFRRVSKKKHPDVTNGKAEPFIELKKAFDLLMDDTRRARYDETGETDEKRNPSEEVKRQELERAISEILEATIKDKNRKENTLNAMKKMVSKVKSEAENQCKEKEDAISKFDSFYRSLKFAGDNGQTDVFSRVIKTKKLMLKDEMSTIQLHIENCQSILDILNLYKSNEKEPKPMDKKVGYNLFADNLLKSVLDQRFR